MIAYVR